MWIYLLRHGIAEVASTGMTDEQRELTDEGRERLQRAARTWPKLLSAPDVVISSPLIRARQTCEILCQSVGFAGDVRIEEALVPYGRPIQALTLLEGELLSQTGSVALVGHEPNMGYLLGALLTGSEGMPIPMKKGMLVGVQVTSTTNVIGDLRFAFGQKVAGRLS